MTDSGKPRWSQQGYSDPLATPEQLEHRVAGRYDPRPASGEFVARRVKLICGRCGDLLGYVDDFELRELIFTVKDRLWHRSPGGLKCDNCYGPMDAFGVDLDAIHAASLRARRRGTVVTVQIGGMPRK